GEIDTITGATISSKAVINIINHGLEEWMPVLEQGIPPAPESTGNADPEKMNPENGEAKQ
ncbi:MAG: FMN-binding protein, partial [Xanthomonadales bacterium]|nr:FMN-binding protein [Xanthomonadales bacterium]